MGRFLGNCGHQYGHVFRFECVTCHGVMSQIIAGAVFSRILFWRPPFLHGTKFDGHHFKKFSFRRPPFSIIFVGRRFLIGSISDVNNIGSRQFHIFLAAAVLFWVLAAAVVECDYFSRPLISIFPGGRRLSWAVNVQCNEHWRLVTPACNSINTWPYSATVIYMIWRPPVFFYIYWRPVNIVKKIR